MDVTMKQCQDGHTYDSEKYSLCPECGIDLGDEDTRGMEDGSGQTQQWPPPPGPDGDDEKTRIKIGLPEEGIDPIVGWLVCIEGKNRGRDYRLKVGKNFLGRSPQMDVFIAGDAAISRERAALITFDPKNSQFWIGPGEAQSNVYLNDKLVLNSEKLEAKNIIELGDSKLMFVPLCGEGFTWD